MRRLTVARVLLVGVAIVGAAVAGTRPAGIIQMVAWAFSLAAAGLFAPLVLGIWWKRTTAAGAIAGMIVGFGVCAYYLVGTRYFDMPLWFGIRNISSALFGLPLAFLVTWAVSLMTARAVEGDAGLRRFDPRSQGRARLGQGGDARIAAVFVFGLKGPFDAGLSFSLQGRFCVHDTIQRLAVAGALGLALGLAGCARGKDDQLAYDVCLAGARRRTRSTPRRPSPPRSKSNIQASTGDAGIRVNIPVRARRQEGALPVHRRQADRRQLQGHVLAAEQARVRPDRQRAGAAASPGSPRSSGSARRRTRLLRPALACWRGSAGYRTDAWPNDRRRRARVSARRRRPFSIAHVKAAIASSQPSGRCAGAGSAASTAEYMRKETLRASGHAARPRRAARSCPSAMSSRSPRTVDEGFPAADVERIEEGLFREQRVARQPGLAAAVVDRALLGDQRRRVPRERSLARRGWRSARGRRRSRRRRQRRVGG